MEVARANSGLRPEWLILNVRHRMDASHDIFAKDDSHPIPDLDVIDVHGERKDGGHDMVIVIVSALMADERSQRRLLEKIARYLKAIAGLNTRKPDSHDSIIVHIKASSDPIIFDLLERARPWIEENHAALQIKEIA
jgi:hypothetical protein